MREIIFLILFSSISIDKCFPVNTIVSNMLGKDGGLWERIMFLVPEGCINFNDHKNPFMKEVSKDQNQFDQRDVQYCMKTIGFLPINENKVKVFLTTDKSADGIKLYYRKDKTQAKTADVLVYSCGADGLKDGQMAYPELSKFPLKITETESEINLAKLSDQLVDKILQCKSFNLETASETGSKTVKDFFKDFETPATKKSEWIFISNTIEYQAEHDDKFFDKMRCDPEKLVNKKDEDEPGIKEYKELEKTEGDADKIIKLIGNLNELKSVIDSAKCTEWGGKSNNQMMYIKNNEIQKAATKIDCKLDNTDNEWKYHITPLVDTPFFAKKTDIIKVSCSRLTCRMCNNIIPQSQHIICGDKECEKIEVVSPSPLEIHQNQCASIKTDKCKIMQLNEDTEFKNNSGSAETFCENKEYKFDGRPVKTITCAKLFPISLNDKTSGHITEELENAGGTMKPKPANNCHLPSGCHCQKNDGVGEKDQEFLAIAGKNDTWIRIETLKFNGFTNTWTYTQKTNKDGKMRTVEKKTSPLARCVGMPKEIRRSQAQKAKDEGGKMSVYVVNIVLIAVFAAVVIPSVIFYVNARIKKREALKAAKKDKKKEDKKEEQSGDKKSDEKKPDEKKNEA